MASMHILGIETSCDETAAAVVADGRRVLSSAVASQVEVHHAYGGVVPELASRRHLEVIGLVVEQALGEAGLEVGALEGVAVTQGPGLVGALLVGFSFAKALAYARGLPWVGVNHLEGHLHSVLLGDAPPPFPFLALLASGGHTSLYHVTSATTMELMGQTRDDAAGEAFDKVAKVLGLGYPGGEVIDRLARQGDPGAVVFKRPYLGADNFDFSFSGLKSAVNRYVAEHREALPSLAPNIAAGFQEAVVDVLTQKLLGAARARDCRHVAIVGGVAANARLRERVRQAAAVGGLTVHAPPLWLCGDNAAMVAAVGYYYLREGRRGSLTDDVYSRNRA
jgi:N6-L-threonylcarbamoyladenine synthase